MKRAVTRAKRGKTSTGAKRQAPRRRAAAKTTTRAKPRRTKATVSKTTKLQAAQPRRRAVAKKKVARKTPRKSPARLKKLPETVPSTLTLPADKTLPVTESTGTKLTGKVAVVQRRRSAPRKSLARRPKLNIPPILLEGDEPEPIPVSGPGEKFALGPETPAAHFVAAATHLPATYGTGKLFLTARDPHWLYAHWDIPHKDQFLHNARSVDRHLILRMHEGELANKPAAEIHVHPESRHWFAHVERAGTQYIADLGYYQPGRKWKSLATSAPMRTPPDSVSTDSTVEFATIPLDLPFETMLSLLQETEERTLPLAHAIQHLRDRRVRDRRLDETPTPPRMPAWTAEQARALAEILASAQTKPALRGSEESADRPGEFPNAENWAAGLGPFNLPSSVGEYVSSPLGSGPTEQAFWFKVNAELIVYGSAKPGAKVSIGGKPIALQPDGSFKYHFALPDGQYELPVVAVSADDTDGRAAQLKFARATEVFGEVGADPQDPALKPPTSDDV